MTEGQGHNLLESQ